MKFQLVKTYRYWWPVIVRVPDPDNAGKFIEQTFKAEFEAIGRDENREIVKAFEALKTVEEREAHEHDVLRRSLKNWDDITEEDKKTPVPFTPENFEAGMQHTWFRTGLYNALRQSLNGEEARLGN